jgi:hypothetical protein
LVSTAPTGRPKASAARSPRCGECPVEAGCPSSGLAVRVPVPRQAPFGGSARATRGAILRELTRAPGHSLPASRVTELLGDEPAVVLDGLEREGFTHRVGGYFHLGPPRDAT